MGRKAIDLTGKRFGRLTVIERASIDSSKEVCWLCRCDCGNITKPIRGNDLKRGKVISCGCYRKQLISERQTIHGLENTRIYNIWNNMKYRCYNSKSNNYKHYGGRGITVCEEWKNSVQAFYEWAMSHGYSDELTLDRIDVNGNYEPSNCHWATVSEQNKNRRKFNRRSQHQCQLL